MAGASPVKFSPACNGQKGLMDNGKVIGVIPARMASTRMPGKPLATILGLPMIEHVRRRVELCPLIDETIVATCDSEIVDVVLSNGGVAVMTSDQHERCTDRVAEAVAGMEGGIIVNVQGDEPFLDFSDMYFCYNNYTRYKIL